MAKGAPGKAVAGLVYPHQLFEAHPALEGADLAVLVEDPLFFRQYAFHRQKLLLHRASMKAYAAKLEAKGFDVRYVEASEFADTAAIGPLLSRWKVREARLVDPTDDWLLERVLAGLAAAKVAPAVLDDPHFLTTKAHIEAFPRGKKKLFFTDFYIEQRKELRVLVHQGKPRGGKWSFDTDNRKKLPAKIELPPITPLVPDAFSKEAEAYVDRRFPGAPGRRRELLYPWHRDQALRRLEDFCERRLRDFGDYEDAITRRSPFLFHSVLTPSLNVGLLSPREVTESALRRLADVPLNSLEGFVRQVIGWREFVRLVYVTHGRRQRTRNYWNMRRPLPKAFYDGTTGVEPVDHVIRSVLELGYCHHIERLMILGNFMLLAEIHPDAIYQWFMELFVDAYDWVMVPNVYGMSQHADGGFMTTKPYLSGSAYVLKMSDFPKGEWCAVWDALYWSFVDRHEAFFRKNPRMAVMVKMRDKLGSKMDTHRKVAAEFLEKLHSR